MYKFISYLINKILLASINSNKRILKLNGGVVLNVNVIKMKKGWCGVCVRVCGHTSK